MNGTTNITLSSNISTSMIDVTFEFYDAENELINSYVVETDKSEDALTECNIQIAPIVRAKDYSYIRSSASYYNIYQTVYFVFIDADSNTELFSCGPAYYNYFNNLSSYSSFTDMYGTDSLSIRALRDMNIVSGNGFDVLTQYSMPLVIDVTASDDLNYSSATSLSPTTTFNFDTETNLLSIKVVPYGYTTEIFSTEMTLKNGLTGVQSIFDLLASSTGSVYRLAYYTGGGEISTTYAQAFVGGTSEYTYTSMFSYARNISIMDTSVSTSANAAYSTNTFAFVILHDNYLYTPLTSGAYYGTLTF